MKATISLRSICVTLACVALLGTGVRAADEPAPDGTRAALPRLVDLGAGTCIACRMMEPILESLTEEYAGQLEVVFIDVWENRDAGKRYDIRVIPTQIFYDAIGKELFRHEGFMPKKDILAKWRELGVELKPLPASGER